MFGLTWTRLRLADCINKLSPNIFLKRLSFQTYSLINHMLGLFITPDCVNSGSNSSIWGCFSSLFLEPWRPHRSTSLWPSPTTDNWESPGNVFVSFCSMVLLCWLVANWGMEKLQTQVTEWVVKFKTIGFGGVREFVSRKKKWSKIGERECEREATSLKRILTC